jgi:purine-nucleoside/S-methyl-5'-thioadenosine phosphorylase / adenosine deaminase
LTSPRSSSNDGPPFPAGTWSAHLPGGAELVCAGRAAGDFSHPWSPGADERRQRLAPVPWTWLRQVHGADVVVVDQSGSLRGVAADAAVTRLRGVALAVTTADCAPIGLSSPEGVGGVVHAGWRGLVAGVVQAAVDAMGALGAGTVWAAVGPCIRPHAYRFSAEDLDAVASRLGPAVRATDADGFPALDLPAAARAALERAGAHLVGEASDCTHCSGRHWSWRTRQDRARQVNVLVTAVAA